MSIKTFINPIIERKRELYNILTNSRSGLVKNLGRAKAKMHSAMLKLCFASDPNNIPNSDKTAFLTYRQAYNKLNAELDSIDDMRFNLTHGLYC